MTILYFLRHATAEVIRPGQLDIDRCLIDKGRQQAMRVGSFILKQGVNPQRVFSSPYPRAIQTAAIVCEQALLAPAEEVDWLALDTPVTDSGAALQGLLTQLPAQSLLIGHEPDLSLLISHLLGVDLPILKVRKASLTCLQLAEPQQGQQPRESAHAAPIAQACWRLQWSVPVKFMP